MVNLNKMPDADNPHGATLPWDNYLSADHDHHYDKLMIKLFKNDVEELSDRSWYVPNVDWTYIDSLTIGAHR